MVQEPTVELGRRTKEGGSQDILFQKRSMCLVEKRGIFTIRERIRPTYYECGLDMGPSRQYPDFES